MPNILIILWILYVLLVLGNFSLSFVLSQLVYRSFSSYEWSAGTFSIKWNCSCKCTSIWRLEYWFIKEQPNFLLVYYQIYFRNERFLWIVLLNIFPICAIYHFYSRNCFIEVYFSWFSSWIDWDGVWLRGSGLLTRGHTYKQTSISDRQSLFLECNYLLVMFSLQKWSRISNFTFAYFCATAFKRNFAHWPKFLHNCPSICTYNNVSV